MPTSTNYATTGKAKGGGATTGKLTDRDIKRLVGPPLATPWAPDDLLFPDYAGGDVFDTTTDVGDIKEMLRRSGKARSLEQVLTLPLCAADWTVAGDGEIATFVRDTLTDHLDMVIDQATSAVAYRRAFFELVWTTNEAGRVVYEKIALRPAVACEAAWNPDTGQPTGFRQRLSQPTVKQLSSTRLGPTPGYARIPASKAFIYTHGQNREPVKGVSDLDVARWCWDSEQKLLFLLCQFLEQQSLPKIAVYGDDLTTADANAHKIAEAKASGVVPLSRPGDPQAKAFEVLESSGKGSDQFLEAIRYFDTMMVSSVLAGFTELAASTTTGSYALSKDQSEFFLASRQAVADEIAAAITQGIIRPLVVYNFGADAEIPRLEIGPLAHDDTDRALTLLTSIVAAPQLNVPGQFVDELVKAVASFLGLDEKTIADAIAEHAQQRAEDEQVKREQAKTLAEQQKKALNTPAVPPGVPKAAAEVGKAVHGAAAVMATTKPAKGTPQAAAKATTTGTGRRAAASSKPTAPGKTTRAAAGKAES